MHSKIQKWGNSLGLRIPKALAEAVGIKPGAEVQIVVEGNELVVRPVRRNKYCLGELLDQVDSGNIHDEIDSGVPAGRELW